MLDYMRIVLATRTERGASAVEYGLLVAGVALACVLGFETAAFLLRAVFEHQNAQLEGP